MGSSMSWTHSTIMSVRALSKFVFPARPARKSKKKVNRMESSASKSLKTKTCLHSKQAKTIMRTDVHPDFCSKRREGRSPWTSSPCSNLFRFEYLFFEVWRSKPCQRNQEDRAAPTFSESPSGFRGVPRICLHTNGKRENVQTHPHARAYSSPHGDWQR